MSDIETKLREALIAIAEGYPVRGEADRFVLVENPKFKEDNGSDPNICIDTFELRGAASQRMDTIAALRKQVSDAVGALEPFAEAGTAMLLTGGKNPKMSGPRLAEHLERAREVLATLTGGKADA